MPGRRSDPHAHAYTRQWWVRCVLVGLFATTVFLVGPTERASAAPAIQSSPQPLSASVNGNDVTVSWYTSESSSSELAWDKNPHLLFGEFANATSNTAQNLGTAHSRTLYDLTPGRYFYQVRSQNAGGAATRSGQFVVAPGTGSKVLLHDVVTDGTVTASTVRQEGTVTRTWIAGTFTKIGIPSGPGVAIDPANSTKVAPGMPRVEGGNVTVSTDDGAGGWYIGGSFTSVGGVPTKHVAHIFADGGVDPHFVVNGFTGTPTIRALDYDSVNVPAKRRLYVGGFFSWSGGISNLVALNATGERDTSFNVGSGATCVPTCTTNGGVHALLVDPRPETDAVADAAEGVFVGGRFDLIGGESYSNLAKLEFNGGRAVQKVRGSVGGGSGLGLPVTATFRTGDISKGGSAANATVRALAFYDQRDDGMTVVASLIGMPIKATIEPRIIIGGDFDRVEHIKDADDTGGPLVAVDHTHNNLAIIDTAVGTQQTYVNLGILGSARYGGRPLGPINAADGTVTSLATTAALAMSGATPSYGNDHIYVGGSFQRLYGEVRNGLGRIDVAMDVAAWNLDPTFTPLGTTVVAGAQVDTISLACTAPSSSTTIIDDCGGSQNAGAHCSKIYLAGSVLGVTQQGMAAVKCGPTDPPSGAGAMIGSFAPGLLTNSAAKTVSYARGRTYVGGSFSKWEGYARNGMAQFDKADGDSLRVTTFAPAAAPASGTITTMSANADRVYVGGDFTNLAGRNHVAAFDRSTGALAASFHAYPQSPVNAVLATPSRVWIGGDFTEYKYGPPTVATCGPCTKLAVVDADGLPIAAYAALQPNGSVNSMVEVGSSIFIGGSFSSITAGLGGGIAKVNEADGTVDPGVGGATAKVDDLASDLEDNVYFTGANHYGVPALGGFAKLAPTAYALANGFAPQAYLANAPDTFIPSQALAVLDDRVYLGGPFSAYEGSSRLAVFNGSGSHVAPALEPQVDGAVATAAAASRPAASGLSSQLVVGGAFDTFDGRSGRGGLALVQNLKDSSGDSTEPNPSSVVVDGFTTGGPIRQVDALAIDIVAGGDASGIHDRTLQKYYAPFDPDVPGQCSLASSSWVDVDVNLSTTIIGPLPRVTLANLDPGCYQFRLEAVDNYGNVRFDSGPTEYSRIDAVNPTGAITVPITAQPLNSVTLGLAVADDSGIASWSLEGSWAPGVPICSGSVAISTCVINTTSLAEGAPVLTLRAQDMAGNSGVVAAESLVVDHTGPNIAVDIAPGVGASSQYVPPNSNDVWFDPAFAGAFTVTAAVNDTGVGVASTTFGAVPSWLNPTAGPTPEEQTYSWTSGQDPVADEVITITSLDLMGNPGTASVRVHADDVQPTGTLTYADGRADVPSITITSADDASGSGLASTKLLRREAPIATDGTCTGSLSWGTWTPESAPLEEWAAPASVPTVAYADTTALAARCYQYRLLVRDWVGHETTVDSANVVQTDAWVTMTRVGATDVAVEGGDTVSYDIALKSAPTSVVTVALAPSARVTVDQSSVTFTPTDWATARRIVVTAIDNTVDENDDGAVNVAAIIHTTSSASGTDPNYDGRPTIPFNVKVRDNDATGFVIDSREMRVVREGATGASVSVKLSRRPGANVTVGASTANGQLNITGETVFTPGDWDVAHVLNVAAVADGLVEGTVQASTQLTVASADDALFRDLQPVSLPFSITDNDTAGLTLVPGTRWKLSDNGDMPITEGGDAIVHVRATGDPLSAITVTPKVDPSDKVTITPESATIAPGTHLAKLTFTVTAADNSVDDTDATAASLSWDIQHSDVLWGAVALPETKLSILDNDATPPRTTQGTDAPPAPAQPAATPNPSTPPPATRTPVPRPAAPAPQAQPRTVLPMAQPTKSKPRATAKPAAKSEPWVKRHKAAAAAITATGLAAGTGAAMHVFAGKSLLALLKDSSGIIQRLLMRFGLRNPKNLERLATMRKGRRRSADDLPRRRRKPSRAAEPDVLEELRQKYQPKHADPLDALERGPGSDRPDMLADLESRLDGFDLDDAA